MKNTRSYMNPYLAGFLLGLVILFSFYLTGAGPGASGAYKRVLAKVEQVIVPAHVANAEASYFHQYTANGQNPLNNRLVFMAVGILAGGFISGRLNKRTGFQLERGPNTTNRTRIIGAVAGGALFGIGSGFARGCTSGAGLDALATLATSGFVTIGVMFGVGYMAAWFFRKLWI